MRRLALIGPLFGLGLVLVLPGCTGFGDFAGNTVTYGVNPNAPVGDAENMRRARGLDAEVEPLVPEPGNIWPGPVKPLPTLQDLEKSGFEPPPSGEPALPAHRQPTPRGSSTPPGSVEPPLPPELQTPPPAISSAPPAPRRSGRTVQTPQTNGVTSGGTSGYQTLTTPQGSAVVVPNGNGTSTVIHSNGTVETIPTPK